jgi:hypothetical protein
MFTTIETSAHWGSSKMAVTFTQRAADRISRAIKWVEQQIRTQGNTEGTVTPRSVEPTYVLTTSGTATSGFYPGKVVLYSAADAAWQEYSTCKILPANGETLTNNTRYAARYTGRNSGGDGVFTVLQGGGGGLSTVDEVDGSPTYSAITYLSFDQADGFALSNPSTGKVRIDISPASTSQTGVVNTTSQTFGGKKTFNNGINTYDVQLNGWDGGYAGIAMTHGWSTDPYNRNAVYIFADTTSGTSAWSYGLNIYWDGANSAIGSGDPGPNTYFNMLSMNVQGTQIVKVGTVGGSGFTGYLSSTASTFIVNGTSGLTGILKSNPQATGGIITNLGNTSTQSSSWMGF